MWQRADAGPADAVGAAVDVTAARIYFGDYASTLCIHIVFVVKLGLVDISKYGISALR